MHACIAQTNNKLRRLTVISKTATIERNWTGNDFLLKSAFACREVNPGNDTDNLRVFTRCDLARPSNLRRETEELHLNVVLLDLFYTVV